MIMRIFFFVVVLAWCCIIGVLPPGYDAFAAAGPAVQLQERQDDLRRLEGRWVRPDGGYVLELRDINKDGSLKAFYANPSRQIKVFSAKWNRKKGQLRVFVELRDVNYPGSKYDLQYDPKSDRLKGTYFQAAEKQTYAIEFVRNQ